MAKREGRPSVAEALEGHVTLDIECFDRMVFTAYVPLLQSGGGVVTFLREHRGNPIPSPALFAPIGEAFRSAVRRFAEEHGIPLIPFRSRQDKLATVRPHLADVVEWKVKDANMTDVERAAMRRLARSHGTA